MPDICQTLYSKAASEHATTLLLSRKLACFLLSPIMISHNLLLAHQDSCAISCLFVF